MESNLEEFYKKMKLRTTMQTTNFVLFDLNLKLKRYLNSKQIMDEYFVERYKKYGDRKDYLLSRVSILL